MEAYLQHGKPGDSMLTERVPIKEDLLPWQRQGLTYTSTGYGKKIPTPYKVKWEGRWYRVYCAAFSNNGADYIATKEGDIVVSIYR